MVHILGTQQNCHLFISFKCKNPPLLNKIPYVSCRFALGSRLSRWKKGVGNCSFAIQYPNKSFPVPSFALVISVFSLLNSNQHPLEMCIRVQIWAVGMSSGGNLVMRLKSMVARTCPMICLCNYTGLGGCWFGKWKSYLATKPFMPRLEGSVCDSRLWPDQSRRSIQTVGFSTVEGEIGHVGLVRDSVFQSLPWSLIKEFIKII